MAILALESRVHSVTVYRSGALVTRRAALPRGAGGYPEVVRVAGLPLALEDSSLRARIEVDRDGEVPIATGLRVALDVPDAGVAVEPPADAKVLEARRQVLELQARRDQLQAEVEVLRALHAPPRPAPKEGEPPPPVPTEARLELVTFRHEELERRQAELRQVGLELNLAAEMLRHLEHQRERAGTARAARENELRKTAVVDLTAREARADTAWLDVEYLVPGARWVPAYALELDGDCTKGRLAVRALVCQATGEDWPGVAMRLSTADAQAWSELPELTSLRIGRRQATGRRGWVPPPTGADELYGDYDRAVQAGPGMLARGGAAAAEGAFAAGNAVQLDAGVTYAEAAVEAELSMDAPATKSMARSRRKSPDAEVRDRMEQFGGPDGIVDAAMPAMAPARAMMSMAGAPAAPRKGGAAGYSGAAPRPPKPHPRPAAPDALRPDSALLAYGRLRLAPPGGPGRGQLQPLPLSQEYLELLAELHVSVLVDVNAAITHARRNATSSAHSRAVPPRHVAPGPIDGFDYAYRADFPLDVPSDGDFHGVTLALRDGPVELKHVCVPRETADVFRVVTMVNPLDAPLLQGPVDISVAGEFRLTSPLHTVPSHGRLEIGLGVEPAIKVARNTRYREETGGLMSTSLTLDHEVSIDVINHLKRRAVLEVRERIPVTREGEDQATVTLGAVSPPWKDYKPVGQDLRGGHAWHLAVEPGDKVQLKAGYSIAIASKNELVGGNRRES